MTHMVVMRFVLLNSFVSYIIGGVLLNFRTHHGNTPAS